MKKIYLIICLIPFILTACTSESEKKTTQNEHGKTEATNSNDSVINESEHDNLEDYELNYVISIASGYNYDSLRRIAIEASSFLEYKFDTLDRYYNPQKRRIVLPDNYEDDVYAGEYYFRRDPGEFISIEMQAAYIDTLLEKNKVESDKFYTDSLKMFVFASMFTDKNACLKLYNKLKPRYSQTKIITTNIFLGCMH